MIIMDFSKFAPVSDDHHSNFDLLVRFVGKDQSVMAATCLANPGLCLLVKSNGDWFYLQVIS